MSTKSPAIPIHLPLARWPDPDRAAWAAILDDDDLMDDPGPGQHWAQGSRRVHLQGYGAWLSFLMRTMPSALHEAPPARVTPERVSAYIVEMNDRPADGLDPRCVDRLAPITQAGRILSLYLVIRGFAPAGDWTWLNRAAMRLKKQSDPLQFGPYIPVSAAQLFQWAIERLENLAEAGASELQSIAFRDTLAVGLLIACPVRRRAFCALEVERRLERTQSGYMLHFRPEDMKDGKSRSFPVHPRLTGPMDSYLHLYRPLLLGHAQTAALWIARGGTRLAEHSLYTQMCRTTERVFGCRLSVHDFRRIAATSIAEYDPAHAGIIRDVLGHSTMDMANRHYNQARALDALDSYQRAAEAARCRANMRRRR